MPITVARISRWIARNIDNSVEYMGHLSGFKRDEKSLKKIKKKATRGITALESLQAIFPVFPAGGDWDRTATVQINNIDECRIIFKEADKAKKHFVDLLGSGDVCINKNGSNYIDWHCDQISGERWPSSTFYKFTRTVRRNGSDIKWVRELSRCEHIVRLAQAYRLKKNGCLMGSFHAEEYASECVEQILSWIRGNAWPWGSNWQCTMDVGLRAMNWLLALDLIRDSPPLAKEEATEIILLSLAVHGKHIYANPECYLGAISSNHYIADLVSQIVLGLSLNFIEGSDEWVQSGLEELKREVAIQITPSGACFEASTGYHRLDYEMLLWPILALKAKGREVPQWLDETVERMRNVTKALLKMNGEVPAFGDHDNGRALKLFPRENITHDYLVEMHDASLSKYPEALWSFGPPENEKSPEKEENISRIFSFKDVGWHGVRAGGWDLSIVCGPIGTSGLGSHSHNDQLSLDLAVDGANIIGDPGSYVYTSDPVKRDEFRSTRMHSTVYVKGVEQCRYRGMFGLENDGQGKLLSFEKEGENRYLINGVYEGRYRHERSMRLNIKDGSIEGSDHVESMTGPNLAWWCLILDPAVKITIENSTRCFLNTKGLKFALEFISVDGNGKLGMERIGYSRSYGKMEETYKLLFSINLPGTLRWNLRRI